MRKLTPILIKINLFFFVLTFLLFLFSFLGVYNPVKALDYKSPVYDGKEQYDPSLAYINSLDKLEAYCDSAYAALRSNRKETDVSEYTSLLNKTISNRFYWGYSCYDAGSNYLSLLFSKFTYWGYDAIVSPNDILKSPHAACSQQSLVMMEILRRKGISTRKVGFWGKRKQAGHFAFEVFYNGSWHFFDPTLEPDTTLLKKLDWPDINTLVHNQDTLISAYKNIIETKGKDTLLDIFRGYFYGSPNSFSAQNMLLFHNVTKFLSKTIFLLFLLIHFILVKSSKVNDRTHYLPIL
jgi:hypothetical protein